MVTPAGGRLRLADPWDSLASQPRLRRDFHSLKYVGTTWRSMLQMPCNLPPRHSTACGSYCTLGRGLTGSDELPAQHPGSFLESSQGTSGKFVPLTIAPKCGYSWFKHGYWKHPPKGLKVQGHLRTTALYLEYCSEGQAWLEHLAAASQQACRHQSEYEFIEMAQR